MRGARLCWMSRLSDRVAQRLIGSCVSLIDVWAILLPPPNCLAWYPAIGGRLDFTQHCAGRDGVWTDLCDDSFPTTLSW